MKSIVAAALLSVLAAGSAVACPNYAANPSFGQISLSAGFLPDPYVRNITAGGGGTTSWVASATLGGAGP